MPRTTLHRLMERLRNSVPFPLVALDFVALFLCLLSVLLFLAGVLSKDATQLAVVAFVVGLIVFAAADLQYMLATSSGRWSAEYVSLAKTPISFWLHVAVRTITIALLGLGLLIGAYESAATYQGA